MPSHAYPKGSLGAILVILGYQNLISPRLCRHPSMFTSVVFELKRRFSARKKRNMEGDKTYRFGLRIFWSMYKSGSPDWASVINNRLSFAREASGTK